MGYTTILHVLVVLGSIGLLGDLVRALRTGDAARRGNGSCGPASLAFVAWMIVMKPVYNGDMGIYRWKLRFAGRSGSNARRAFPARAKRPTGRRRRATIRGSWATAIGPRSMASTLETDWQAHPPEEVWRHEIGGGWSGFAIVGNYAVTQEQRGDEEIVSCYRVDNGEVVWTHADEARFDPADFQGGLGGIGPRATPTIHDGKILTQGATGIVNCLDARTGKVIWSHDTAEETGADVIIWGKSGSPLVVDDLVIVNVGAPNDEAEREDYNSSLVAYDLETGDVRWAAGNRQASYSSPLLTTLAGERQIVMVNEKYITAHRVDDGSVLWEYPWAERRRFERHDDAADPARRTTGCSCRRAMASARRCCKISKDADGKFAVEPLWDPPIKRVMKTKFANAVVRDGYVYGLDDVLLSCIEAGDWQGPVEEAARSRVRPRADHARRRRDPGALGDGRAGAGGSDAGRVPRAGAASRRSTRQDTTWNTPAFAPPYLLDSQFARGGVLSVAVGRSQAN